MMMMADDDDEWRSKMFASLLFFFSNDPNANLFNQITSNQVETFMPKHTIELSNQCFSKLWTNFQTLLHYTLSGKFNFSFNSFLFIYFFAPIIFFFCNFKDYCFCCTQFMIKIWINNVIHKNFSFVLWYIQSNLTHRTFRELVDSIHRTQISENRKNFPLAIECALYVKTLQTSNAN